MDVSKQVIGLLLTAVSVVLCSVQPAKAAKPDNQGGGGGGGGGAQVELIDIHPTGSNYSQANAINDSGIVVGSVDDVAGFWDTATPTPNFTPLSGSALTAKAINEEGAIVGDGSGPTYWASLSADPVSLPLPPGYTNGRADGISRDGIVIGEVFGGSSSSASVAWHVTESNVFGPVFLPNASSVNDVASLQSGTNRAVGRSDGGPRAATAKAWDLELYPDGSFTVADSAILTPGESSVAYAITERGDVSGQVYGDRHGADLDTTEDSAFVIRNGSLKFLKAGGGNRIGIGFDLNDSYVVGATTSYYWAPLQYATRWNSRNQPENLSESYFDDNWSTAIANGINDGGDIVGFGNYGGEGHAWLLRRPLATSAVSNVVPEPSTFLIATVCGFALLTLLGRRTKVK